MSDSQSTDDDQALDTYDDLDEPAQPPPPNKKSKKTVVTTTTDEQSEEEEKTVRGGGGGGGGGATMKHDKISLLLAGYGIKRSEKKIARWEQDDTAGLNAIIELVRKRDSTVVSGSTVGRLVAYDKEADAFVLVVEKNLGIRVMPAGWDQKQMKQAMPHLVADYGIDTTKYKSLEAQTFALIQGRHIKTTRCEFETKLAACVLHDKRRESSVWLNSKTNIELLGPVINCGKVKSVTKETMERQLVEITKTRRELLRLIGELEQNGGGGEAMVLEKPKAVKKATVAEPARPPKKKARTERKTEQPVQQQQPQPSEDELELSRLKGMNSDEIGEFFAASRRELCTTTFSQKERERIDWFAKYQ